MKSLPRRVIAAGIGLILLCSVTANAQGSRRQDKDKSDDELPISIMDSSQAQWGMRSVNDSVYQGYPMNAVYLERGRTRLPDIFPRYQSGKLGNEIVIRASGVATPSSIRVNGVDTPLSEND